MKLLIALSIVCSILSLYSCGSSEQQQDTTISYDFTENDCKTEKHTFNDLKSYCTGLESDKLNKNCAYHLRRAAWESNCKGKV